MAPEASVEGVRVFEVLVPGCSLDSPTLPRFVLAAAGPDILCPKGGSGEQ